MTWVQLREEIIKLGFEEYEVYQEDTDLFYYSVNRAVNLISSTVRPVIRKYAVTQNALPNLLGNGLMDMKMYNGTPVVFSALNPKSYYFECDGTGTATLSNGEDEDIEIELNSDRNFKAYKGFVSLKGTITLTFKGEYAYNIRNAAMFAVLFSGDTKDIPNYTKENRYDISELTKNEKGECTFQDLAYDMPVSEGNLSDNMTYRIVEDYKIEERKIIIFDYFETGQFIVWYKKRPERIDKNTPDNFEIELDYDVQVLLPLLSAHYIWLDDEERKAILYWNEYDQLKNEILANSKNKIVQPTLISKTGWW